MAYSRLDNCSTPHITELENKVSSDNSRVVQSSWQRDSIVQAIRYDIIDGGHTIPHEENQLPKVLGTTNKDINAPHLIWAFFKQLKANK